MPTVKVTIDGKAAEVREGSTILQAAARLGIRIPTLCHEWRLEPFAACRVCLVEVEGARTLIPSCYAKVTPNMVVKTNTERVIKARKLIIELLLSNHPQDCLSCEKCGDCGLQNLAYEYGVKKSRFFREPEGRISTDRNEYIQRDESKCVLCGRCVRICAEVQQVCAIDFSNRGFKTTIGPAMGRSLLDSPCELCGQCVSACPVGALSEKQAVGKARAWELKKVRTVCPYCGVGCNLTLNVKDGRIVKATSEVGTVPNNGNLCVKGRFGWDYVHHPDRLKHPLIKRGGQFVEATWDEALDLVAKRFGEIKAQSGSDSLASISSCRCTNEENYLVQKFTRTVLGNNNVDQCARTCHAPTVAGLATSFGSGAMTNSIGEIPDVKVLFIIGANPTEAHPIIGLQMKKALRNGAKLIVADPRKTWLAEHADIHLPLRPGSDNLLVNAMMHVILEEGLENKEFVATRTEGIDELKALVKDITPEKAAEVCSVPADDIRKAARLYAQSPNSAIFYTLGITEHICGTDNVRSLANLAMLTGQIGRPSTGVNPLRGQNNVQGGCDMGALPDVFTGYQKVADPAILAKFEKAWGVKLPTTPGLKMTDMFEAARDGKLKAMFIMGEDPVMSEPHQGHIVQALENLDFLVVQDIFLSETAKLADVVLPGASFAEKDGTFTNTERRVQRVRKAIDPIGNSRPDWEILCELSRRMGYPMNYDSPEDIWNEVASLTPAYAGINYGRIENVGLQWPCPTAEHPGTKFLHEGKFTRGLGKFYAARYRPPAEPPDAEYPLLLTTGRTLFHYNVGNMTRKSKGLVQKQPECFVEVNQADAGRLGFSEGAMVTVESRRGRVQARARVSDRVQPGIVWMPFHFIESAANKLTNAAFDDVARTGEYKVCAAKLSVA